ncbi:MAG: hypothetical protein ABIJ65_11830 [Chloroflexota bacterium]
MRTTRIRLIVASLLMASLACNLIPESLIPRLIFSTPPGLESGNETATPPPGITPTTAGSINSGGESPGGELHFLTDEASISTAGEGWFKPNFGCWPSSYYDDGGGYLRITAGILEGFCSWTSPSQINPQVT